MFTITSLAWLAIGMAVAAATVRLEGDREPGDYALPVIAAGIVSWLSAWYFMTAFSPFLVSTWFHLLLVVVVAVGLDTLGRDGPPARSIAAWGAAYTFLVILATVSSLPLFHANRYASLMVPVIKERDVSVPLVDQSQARLVTDDLARKRAAELLASADEDGLGSRVVVGEVWGNKVGDTMYWIMPLEHSGFWRWMSNDTTPGFIAVSQMNEMNTRFVQNKPLRIGVEAYLDDNVYRHLFNRGFKSEIMGDAIFMVDEQWNPYWLVPLSLPQVGIGGEMPVRWSLVDAVSGEVTTYDDPADVPEWVDRLYHQDMVSERFNDWGCWSQGWWACAFSSNDVIVSTPGINVTIDAGLDIVYYSGTQFSNNKSDGATSGFYTVNARTGKIDFYRRAGITEEAAKAVMDGAFADFEGYHAADNVLLTINGEATYFSVVVDGAGSRKAYALVSQTNRNVFGKGNSIQAALTDYGRSMQRANRDAGFDPGSNGGGQSFEGRVATFMPVVQNERTSFYLTLDSLPGKIVEVSEEKIGEIVVTGIGDSVRITTDNTEPGVVFATSFDNLGFTFAEGGVQLQVDARNEQANEVRQEDALRDETFNRALGEVKALTPDQLRLLLKQATDGE